MEADDCFFSLSVFLCAASHFPVANCWCCSCHFLQRRGQFASFLCIF